MERTENSSSNNYETTTHLFDCTQPMLLGISVLRLKMLYPLYWMY